MNDKRTLRTEIIKRRNEMAEEQITLASDAIFLNLKQCIQKFSFNTIFCYASYNNEVRTSKIMQYFYDEGKDICIPVVTGSEMIVAKWMPEMTYTTNKYGIKEPLNPDFYTKSIDIAIVPGLAFTKSGARLGYGGGYYDKWFAVNPDVYKIGLCYDWQLVKVLPEAKYDVRMDKVICENMKDS